ncbi:MAG: response regulator [Oligoflexia bacterium]|nr:response regulator [Oligoflexia bacterium]MBF0365969.1 response regulator [Oligoflexia bacterium]
MTKTTVFIIEDEIDIAELIRMNLEKNQMKALVFVNGEDALEGMKHVIPDVVILDIVLPGGESGFDICAKIKKDYGSKNIAVIMVTAIGDDADIIRGLELGADDYVTKPFSPRVLMARITAVLRRKQQQQAGERDLITYQDLMINPGKREVMLSGHSIDLTFTEFQILHVLAKRPGWVFTRSQIVNSIRGEGHNVTERSVDVQIVGLRKKVFQEDYDYIETVRGVGYRFRERCSQNLNER